MTAEPATALDGALEAVSSQIGRLADVIKALEAAQRSLPRLSRAELARLKWRATPVSGTAYVLGRLEGAIIDLEDIIVGLTADLGNGLDRVANAKLSRLEFLEIESALNRLTP